MGKWTLAHTEALCSEKFHLSLQKPLAQFNMNLKDFFEAFDPQDSVVQKLIGALVNDVAYRRKYNSDAPIQAFERCAEAAAYIHSRGHSIAAARTQRTTLRARRRGDPTVYPNPYMQGPHITSGFAPWRTGTDGQDVPSAASLNLFEAFNAESPPAEDIPDDPASESSGSYWWRHAMEAEQHSPRSPIVIYPQDSPASPASRRPSSFDSRTNVRLWESMPGMPSEDPISTSDWVSSPPNNPPPEPVSWPTQSEPLRPHRVMPVRPSGSYPRPRRRPVIIPDLAPTHTSSSAPAQNTSFLQPDNPTHITFHSPSSIPLSIPASPPSVPAHVPPVMDDTLWR